MTRPEVDVVVVGGGPAGTSFAWHATRAGLSVIVLERQHRIGEHVRTSGATARTTPESVGAPPYLYHVVDRIRIASHSAEALFETTDLAILDVRAFYQWLGSQAEAAGAEIRCNSRVVDVRRDGAQVTGVVVDRDTYEETISARVIVDAGGHRAQASKLAGLHPGFKRFGVGAETEFHAPHAREDEAVLFVGTLVAPAGYGWAFPWGAGKLRFGLGVHHIDVRENPRELLNRLLDSASKPFGVDLTAAHPFEQHFGLIPAEGPARRIVGDGMVCVGDAAGQASLVAGEGIRIALWAGETAAEVVTAALRAHKRPRASALAEYARRFDASYKSQLRLGARINQTLAATQSDEEWDSRVRLAKTLPPNVVVELLQSRLPMRAVAGWAIRHPSKLRRALRLILP